VLKLDTLPLRADVVARDCDDSREAEQHAPRCECLLRTERYAFKCLKIPEVNKAACIWLVLPKAFRALVKAARVQGDDVPKEKYERAWDNLRTQVIGANGMTAFGAS
jgi:hypothetical protein